MRLRTIGIHPPASWRTGVCGQGVDRARLPPEAPGQGPSCLHQLLGAPGSPGLVAASLLSLPPSSRGFSSVSGSPLLSLRRTLSLDGGTPSSRRTSSQTLPVASPVCLCLLFSLLGGHGPWMEGPLIQEDLLPDLSLHHTFEDSLSKRGPVPRCQRQGEWPFHLCGSPDFLKSLSVTSDNTQEEDTCGHDALLSPVSIPASLSSTYVPLRIFLPRKYPCIFVPHKGIQKPNSLKLFF